MLYSLLIPGNAAESVRGNGRRQRDLDTQVLQRRCHSPREALPTMRNLLQHLDKGTDTDNDAGAEANMHRRTVTNMQLDTNITTDIIADTYKDAVTCFFEHQSPPLAERQAEWQE